MSKSIKDILSSSTNVKLGNIDSLASNGKHATLAVHIVSEGMLISGFITALKLGTEYMFTSDKDAVAHPIAFWLDRNDISAIDDCNAFILFNGYELCFLLVDSNSLQS